MANFETRVERPWPAVNRKYRQFCVTRNHDTDQFRQKLRPCRGGRFGNDGDLELKHLFQIFGFFVTVTTRFGNTLETWCL